MTTPASTNVPQLEPCAQTLQEVLDRVEKVWMGYTCRDKRQRFTLADMQAMMKTTVRNLCADFRKALEAPHTPSAPFGAGMLEFLQELANLDGRNTGAYKYIRKTAAEFLAAHPLPPSAPSMQAGKLDDMPKDGSPFLAKVEDWYHKEQRFTLLKLSMAGNGQMWDSAYSGDQTFERDDILECWDLSVLKAAASEHQPQTAAS